MISLMLISLSMCQEFDNLKLDGVDLTKELTSCFTSAIKISVFKKNLYDLFIASGVQSTSTDKVRQKFESKVIAALNSEKPDSLSTIPWNDFKDRLTKEELSKVSQFVNADDYSSSFKDLDGSKESFTKILIQLGFDKTEAESINKAYFKRYRITPYHNVCHGLYVGLGAASAYLAEHNYVLEKKKLTQNGMKVDKSEESESVMQMIRKLFFSGFGHDFVHLGFTNPGQEKVDKKNLSLITGILAKRPD